MPREAVKGTSINSGQVYLFVSNAHQSNLWQYISQNGSPLLSPPRSSRLPSKSLLCVVVQLPRVQLPYPLFDSQHRRA